MPVSLDRGKSVLVCGKCENPFLRQVGESSGSAGYTNTYRCNQCDSWMTLGHHVGKGTEMRGCKAVPA